MSEQHDNSESSYRPSSPDLSGLTNFSAPLPRLSRIPSYHVSDPNNFPPGYSFSPRGSYDASPFFSPSTTAPSASYFVTRQQSQTQFTTNSQYSPQASRTPSLPGQTPSQHSPPTQSRPLGQPSYHNPPPPQLLQSPYRQPISQTSDQQYLPQFPAPFSPYGGMPRTRRQQAAEANQDPDYSPNPISRSAVQPKAESNLPVQSIMPAVPLDLTSGIDVKTKFPVARIKRIMQADEDVGKVAQATPTAVGKSSFYFVI